MTRILYDNAAGSLGAALDATGTTVTFAVAPPFASVSGGDYVPLILDPAVGPSPSALFEIVYLTGYVSGTVTGTISRAQEGSSASAHASGALWVQGPTTADAASLPTSPDSSVTVGGTASSPTLEVSASIQSGASKGSTAQQAVIDTTAADFKMDGIAAAGATGKLADAGHVHPTDTSRAPLASPALTGTPTVPTAAPGTNTTQVASTAFVTAASSTAQSAAEAASVPLSTVTAAGDLIVGSAAGAVARLPIGTAGQVPTVNSAGTGLQYATPASGGGSSGGYAVFTSSGTWTVPAGVTEVTLHVKGGGAGGSDAGGAGRNGGGGGAGQVSRVAAALNVLDTTLIITVGAGGLHGQPSHNGGTTLIVGQQSGQTYLTGFGGGSAGDNYGGGYAGLANNATPIGSNSIPGFGASAPNAGTATVVPSWMADVVGGAGGGGGQSTTNGGTGGGAATVGGPAIIQPGVDGASPTINGGNGQTATLPGCGGGGGGLSASGSAGTQGVGGNGAPGIAWIGW